MAVRWQEGGVVLLPGLEGRQWFLTTILYTKGLVETLFFCLCRLIRNPTEFVLGFSRKTEYLIGRIVCRIESLICVQDCALFIPIDILYTTLSALSPINDIEIYILCVCIYEKIYYKKL